ncbi:MAG: AAA family ATPase [bacterium]
MKTDLVLLIGIQAAGKTTFSQRLLPDTHVRVNLDTLRNRTREARVCVVVPFDGKMRGQEYACAASRMT